MFRKTLAILIMVSLLTTPAYAITSELVSSQYPGFIANLGIGDRLYKITYDDGSITYQLSRTTFLKTAFISQLPTEYKINPSDYAEVPITILGISKNMDGADWHSHDIEVYDSSGKLVRTEKGLEVNSGKEYVTSLSLGKFDTVGIYKYTVKEFVYLNGGDVRASVDSSKEIKIIVGNPVTTPIITPYSTSQPVYQPTSQPTAQPTAQTGTLIIWSSPSDAKIFINNEEKGLTSSSQYISIQLPVGYYEVKLTKTNYESFAKSATIYNGEQTKIDAYLTKVPYSNGATPAPTIAPSITATSNVIPTSQPAQPVATSTSISYSCPQGYFLNTETLECVQPPTSPSFEIYFAIIALLLISCIALRHNRSK